MEDLKATAKRVFNVGWTNFKRNSYLSMGTTGVMVMVLFLFSGLMSLSYLSSQIVSGLEEKVDVRKEDRTIRSFHIPAQRDLTGEIIRITSFTTLKNHKPVTHKAKISLKKNEHLLLSGPNGIGKSTLLEVIAKGASSGVMVAPGVKVGYYRQDFSTLNFDDTVYDSLFSAMDKQDEHEMRSVAAGFLITADTMYTKIGSLSEGQKGLVAFARLVLQKPGLLIFDEPTNHINFRHIPLIAEALNTYQGAMILVSHVPSFVKKIRIDETLDLEAL